MTDGFRHALIGFLVLQINEPRLTEIIEYSAHYNHVILEF